MRNINEKDSLAESDLEEGEIPEFEVCSNANSAVLNIKENERHQLLKMLHTGGAPDFGRVSDNPLVRIQNPSQGSLKKKSIYFPSDKGRYELPSAEGEYVTDKSKSVMRNQVPQNTFYDYNLEERRLKYLHPFQATYGSVEHIMTKIGETLGRNNDFYYKGRRSNESRSLIKLNSNLGATFRESGSLFRRFRNNYHKKRRYSKSNSDSDREIWETKGKLKRSSVDLRRKEEKDFRKKRKTKCSNASAGEGEVKKIRLPEKSDDGNAESGKPTFGGNERLLKAIRELQVRENEAAESHEIAEEVIPQIASSSLDEKDEEKSVSCVTINLDDNQENRNFEDLSEKSSINGEDSDDDVELIKLRLLALTSNKRKTQGLEGEKNNSEKRLEIPKSDITDDEKEPENPADDMIVGKNTPDNDIDRYELMLRAEALKTALLKKHKNRIKKRKFSSCSLSAGLNNGGDNIIEDPEKQESKAGVEDSSLPVEADSGVSASITEIETTSESHTERTLQLENTLGTANSNHMDVSNEYDNKSNQTGVSQTVKGVNPSGKRSRKRRQRKNRKLSGLNLNELSKKENSGVISVTTEEDDKNTKALLPDAVNQKKALKEHEKKFVLVDSSQLSKSQSAGERKLASDLEQNAVSAKANGAISAATATKIPETEIQRIIVHLGSDSSDDETPTQNVSKSDTMSSKVPENAQMPSPASGDAHSKIVDYEKSVELLLKDARRRIERNMATPQKIPPTPEAVYNHLAPSQRLEYIRLKQKIAETEKLRRMKENMSLTPVSQESIRKNQLKNVKNRVGLTPEIQRKELAYNKISSGIKCLNLKSNVKDTAAVASKTTNIGSGNNRKNKIRTSARNANNDGINSALAVQRDGNVGSKNIINVTGVLGTKMTPKSAANSASAVKKILERKKTLTQNQLHLERLKVLWKNIKMEKMIEDKCKIELKRLKIQQNFFELKISQQRTKIKKLAEESNQIYEAFQRMNKGLQMSAKKKKVLATEKSSPEVVVSKVEMTNVSEKGSPLENVPHVDDVPVPQKKEEGNLVEKIDGIINLEDKEDKAVKAAPPASQGEQMKEYNSPLQRHSTGLESSGYQRVDPNTIMCQYDLTGRCNDEECPYQHVRC